MPQMICTLGDLLLDVIVRLEGPIAEDTDTYGRTRVGAGGQAANVAAWVAALGGPGALRRKAGAMTPPGASSRRSSRARGVDVAGPEVETGTGTVVSIATARRKADDAERPRRGSRLAAGGAERTGSTSCERLHLPAYSSLRLRFATRLAAADARPCMSASTSRRPPRSARRAIDELRGRRSTAPARRRLRERGRGRARRRDRGGDLVVKRGARGCFVYAGEAEERELPGLNPRRSVDPRGRATLSPRGSCSAARSCGSQRCGALRRPRWERCRSGRAAPHPSRGASGARGAPARGRARDDARRTRLSRGGRGRGRCGGRTARARGVGRARDRRSHRRPHLRRAWRKASSSALPPRRKRAKVGPRDLAACAVKGELGATTVGATSPFAAQQGSGSWAQAGSAASTAASADTLDVSADLGELARTEALVVSSGAKSILDVAAPQPRCWRHSASPCSGGGRTSCRSSTGAGGGPPVSQRVQSAEEAAQIAQFHWRLGRHSGIVLARPPDESLDVEPLDRGGLDGGQPARDPRPGVTPFVLSYLHERAAAARSSEQEARGRERRARGRGRRRVLEAAMRLAAAAAAALAALAAGCGGDSTPERGGAAAAGDRTAANRPTNGAPRTARPARPPRSKPLRPARLSRRLRRVDEAQRKPIPPARRPRRTLRDEERLRLEEARRERALPQRDDHRQGGGSAPEGLRRAHRRHAQGARRWTRGTTTGGSSSTRAISRRTVREPARGAVCRSCHIGARARTTSGSNVGSGPLGGFG